MSQAPPVRHSDRGEVRALAAAAALHLADEELERLYPWYLELQQRLRTLRRQADQLPPEIEPHSPSLGPAADAKELS